MKNQIKINKITINQEGKRYITLKQSGIPPLYSLMGGIKLSTFPREKTTYISIEETIRWFKEEEENQTGKNKETIKSNIKFLKGLLSKKLK